MTWKVQVRSEAEADLFHAQCWYENQRAGLGTLFLDELQGLIGALEHNALLYPDRGDGVRLLFAHRFPYVVSYRIEDANVVVFTVFHMRRER